MRRSPTWLLRRVEESFKAALVHRGPLTEAQDIYGVGKELYIGLGVNLVKPVRRTLELQCLKDNNQESKSPDCQLSVSGKSLPGMG